MALPAHWIDEVCADPSYGYATADAAARARRDRRLHRTSVASLRDQLHKIVEIMHSTPCSDAAWATYRFYAKSAQQLWPAQIVWYVDYPGETRDRICLFDEALVDLPEQTQKRAYVLAHYVLTHRAGKLPRLRLAKDEEISQPNQPD
jgi:hypothetical protein